MYFEQDPFTGFRLKPYGKGYFQNNILAQANSHGHRNREVTLSKPPDVYRILVLGDSFTVGANVKEEETYPQVLERLLQELYSPSLEVINTGVGDWSPFQYAQSYEHYGYQFDPDCIILGFFVGNDTYNQVTDVKQLTTAVMGRRVSPQQAFRWRTKIKIFLYQHIHLARLVLTKGYAAKDYNRRDCQDFTPQYLSIQEKRLENHYKYDDTKYQLAQNSTAQVIRIKRLAETAQIPLIVVFIPDENQINPYLQKRLIPDDELYHYDFEMPQSMLKEIFAQYHIPTIDLLPYFRDDPRCLYMNDTHWTPEGHRLAAEIIYEQLPELIKTINIERNARSLFSKHLIGKT